MSSRWIERYRAGDRSAVWLELRQLGATVHGTELAAEAQLVCDEMALRARHNVLAIIERLDAANYRFHRNDDGASPQRPYQPPSDRAPDDAEWLASTWGSVPMTVLSWLRIVGDVWLVGTHPQWAGSSEADPLVVELEGSFHPDDPLREERLDEYRNWQLWKERSPEQSDSFVLPVAPDRFHKANVSGGPPYGFILPDGCVDGLWVGSTTMPFVAYLNQVFAHGGFPHASDGDTDGWQVRRELARGLLPL